MRPAGAPDTLDLWTATFGLPEQMEVAVGAARAIGLGDLPEREAIENVVVLGMGGSGIAGDVLAALASPLLSVPVVVVKSYVLPAFVSDASLVFAVSFSGETEETVEVAGEALAAQAHLVSVTGGGELARLTARAGRPVVGVPGGLPVARAALGALSVPPLVVLETMGLFPGASRWVELAAEQLRRFRPDLERADGPAARLAERLGRTIPVIHSSRALGRAAAQRWKTQMNENARRPAFWGIQPEVCHNEIAGWGRHAELSQGLFSLVNLRHDAEHPQVSRRVDLLAELVGEALADVLEVRARAEGELAQLFELAYVGDAVSLFLAAREGLDPGPTPILGLLKERLAEG